MWNTGGGGGGSSGPADQRVLSMSSSTAPFINTDNYDVVKITAQSAAITSMTANLTGSADEYQSLLFDIKDNGSARAITWGASFEDKAETLPTTTTASTNLLVGFLWFAADSKWGCMMVSE